MAATSRAEQFDKDMSVYEASHPSWRMYLNVSTFFELMTWYDVKHGLGNDERNSMEACDFASYVMRKARLEDPEPLMSVHEQSAGVYELSNMSATELRLLLNMIKGAGLEERRAFDKVKCLIERILKG